MPFSLPGPLPGRRAFAWLEAGKVGHVTDFDPVSDFDPTEPLPPDGHDPEPPLQAGPDSPFPAEETGYLETSGEGVGDDGSVVPIIGGLPAVQGSAWDIGAPADERGAGLAEKLGQPGDHDDKD